MEALELLDKKGKIASHPLMVVTGDDEFLKRRIMHRLQTSVVGDADPAFAVSSYSGDKADFSTVRGELDTLPFLCDARLVVIEQADPFVTRFRSALEKYLEKPAACGVLVLDVKSWTSTTRLAKMVPPAATFVCKAPSEYKLVNWCFAWAKSEYDKKLAKDAAPWLVQLVGPHLGLLDAELHKIADFIGDRQEITIADVDALVGKSRAANVFLIMEAVGDGKPGEALSILHGLLEEGQDPVGILGALSYQLRQLGKTARLARQGMPIEEAMDQAGVMKWPAQRDKYRKQMKHLGWGRLDKLFDWLVEVDQGLKGGSALPLRYQLERLIVRMAGTRP